MSYPVMLGAIVIRAGVNDVIRFTEGAATNSATLEAGTWYLRGDGTADDFCVKLKTALEAASLVSVNTYTVRVAFDIDPAQPHTRIQIARATGADNFGALWVDAATTFDESLLGFTANDAVNALNKVSARSCSASWVSNDIAREIEPYSERVVAVPRAASGRVNGVTRSDRMQSYRLGLAFVDARRIIVVDALTHSGDTLEGFIERFGANSTVELHEQSSIASPGLFTTTELSALSASTKIDQCLFSEDTLSLFAPTRLGPGVALYSIDLTLHRKI